MSTAETTRILVAIPFFLVVSTVCLHAQSREKKLLNACEARITAKYQQWRFVPVTTGVADFAKSRHENPTVTTGDFDGDGRTDVALLIQNGSDPESEYPRRLESLHIAVCLDKKTGIELHVIDRPYCGDGITRAPKGASYYDFETDKRGTYLLDGVSAYCFEKAGATYEFENGAFHQIVDSD
jgi:hypothetical protein